MKSLKTFNLDQDVIHILSKQANKSQYVCKAVRRLSNGTNEVYPSDFPSRQLLASLHARNDISPQMKAVILAELS